MSRNLRMLILVIVGGTAVACSSTESASPEVRTIAAEHAFEYLAEDRPADVVVLDVRTPEEYSEAHLEDAVLLDFYREDFIAALSGLDRDVPYVVYCRSGNRSGQAIAEMEKLGFTDVTNVDGGILAWQTAGLPVG